MNTRFVKIDGEEYGYTGDRMARRSEHFCKSTDPQPIEGVLNADILYEMDTKKVYLFDEDDKVWLEQ